MSGRPRQFWVMKLKSRCSILFHLLVPGGKWQTINCRPNSSASSCRHTFHNRERGPLEPPASAVISNWTHLGKRRQPMRLHQRRMLLTANSAVSWSIPTLTQPSEEVIDSVGYCLAQVL